MPNRNSAALLLVLILTPACKQTQPLSTTSPTPNPSEAMTVPVLVAELRSQEVTVEQLDRMPSSSFPFFAVPAVPLNVNGSRVFAFEYASAAATTSEAARVSPDGFSVGTTLIDWIDVTRFYTNGRVIVVYVGADRRVVGALDAVLGNPFAGSGT